MHALIAEVITEEGTAGALRNDISAEELAGFCIHALEAASHAPS